MDNQNCNKNGTSIEIPRRTESEQGMSFEERMALDLVQQIFNMRPNIQGEKSRLELLINTIGTILKEHTNDKFQTSIKTSSDSIFDTNKQIKLIEKLQNDTPDSFALIPIYTKLNLMGFAIRKEDLKNLSVTVIDKFWSRAGHAQYEEFIIPSEKFTKVLTELNKIDKRLPDDIYTLMGKNSISNYPLRINSKNCVLQNGFTKNIQASIRYLYLTSKMNIEQIKTLRISKDKDIPVLPKVIIPKWPFTNTQMNRKIVDILKERFNNISNPLENEIIVFTTNKVFRNLLKTDSTPDIALHKAFGELVNVLENDDLKNPENLKLLLSCINNNSLLQASESVKKLVYATNDPEYIETFNKTLENSVKGDSLLKDFLEKKEHNNVINKLDEMADKKDLSDALQNDLKQSLNLFPNVTSELKFGFAMGFQIAALISNTKSKFLGWTKVTDYDKKAIDRSQVSRNLYAFGSLNNLAIAKDKKGFKEEAYALVLENLKLYPGNEDSLLLKAELEKKLKIIPPAKVLSKEIGKSFSTTW